jgi:hypothetical protein
VVKTTQQLLQSITEKAKQLKDKTMRLEKENAEYRQTVFKHLATIADLQNAIKNQTANTNANKVAATTNADIVQLKKDIDKYVKVIDKAMAQLQK